MNISKRILVLATSLLLALTLLVGCGATTPNQYLKENWITLRGIESVPDEKSGLSAYTLALIGETQGTVKNHLAQIELIKYFYQVYGTRTIVLETGFCTGGLLNYYIATGDTTYLKAVMYNFEGTTAFSQENYLFYESLFAYNQTLPEDARLTIAGVDIEHQFLSGIFFLRTLLPAEEVPETIASYIDKLRIKSSTGMYTQDDLTQLKVHMGKNDHVYASYFGSSYETVNRTIASIEAGVNYANKKDDTFREQTMIDNLTILLESHTPNATPEGEAPPEGEGSVTAGPLILGIFDTKHTQLNNTKSATCLGTYFATTYAATTGKVANLKTCYINSSYLDVKTGNDKVIKDKTLSSSLSKEMPSDMMFCRLTGPESPFLKTDKGIEAQYYIIIKDSTSVKAFM